ncbi:OmpA/MotB domain-containing protein [Calothrix sp. NIES-2100]|uniref:eCIS core domain-containing protein n=1 Tax=Calothrix sp. NIES-2100 TaxID=1954172 RepID=UPI000B5F2907|nr:OmpA/MotB domain-containing protein [Calothrix sp. NIES-2100]
MSFQRVHQSKNQNSQTSWSTSQFAPRPLSEKEPQALPTQEEIENQAFEQDKFKPTRFEHNFANIPVHHNSSLRAKAIQPKLTIEQPNDEYEQEADRVAMKVMSMASPRTSSIQRQIEEEQTEVQTKPLAETMTPIVQRQEALEDEEPIQAKCEDCETKEQIQRSLSGVPQIQADLESRLHASRGKGSPLPDEVKSFMEPRFKANFSQVRVHTDNASVQMNRELGAKAFTHRSDIYYGGGKFPGNNDLTAHELTHVVQQTSGVQGKTDGKIQKVDDPDAKIPYLVRFNKPLSKEEFIQLADSQIGLEPNVGKWSNVKEHYNASDSPVTVNVAASLVKKSRSAQAAADLGLSVDDAGDIAGAGDRADEFSQMPPGTEKAALIDEINHRYWQTAGISKGEKIKDKTKEAGKVALWKQIRDEVLAQREFISNLPEKAQYILRYSQSGVVITPENYQQVVRIAKKIEQFNSADLENYLSQVKETKNFDVLETGIDKFLMTKQAAPEKIKELLKKTTDDDWDADSAAAKMDANTMFYLPLDKRIEVIKNIANGYVVGDEDEQTIIRLLTSTPSADLKALIDELKHNESALLKKLESVIDGSENKEYYAALRNILFKSLEPEEAQKKMESAKIFPWADPGIIKAVYNRRFYYETVEYTKDGKIRVVFWTNIAMMGMKNQEQILEPDEIIGLHFFMDEDFANAKEGETIFMPAANLLAFKNEQFSRELSLAVDVGLLFAGGAGLVAKGTRLAKAIALLDFTMAAADITISSFRSDIAKTKEGQQFLKAWDTVNTLIAVYGIAKVVVRLPETFRNLKKAYQSFKGNPGKIDPGDLTKIENETTKLFGQADKAALEGEIADLRQKFSANEMAAFEQQLEKAAAIGDATKRQAAIADIQSQISTQKANVDLVAELKKANPKMSNKEIAELAKSKIKVPTVPHGMTADEFQDAQDLIKKFLQDKGLKDVEGFATGSRITGATFNPKKPAFGQISSDFSKKDFDITLVTSRKLTNTETRQLQELYKAKFKHDLGIRNVVDKKQLDYIPVYGKIDLNLK